MINGIIIDAKLTISSIVSSSNISFERLSKCKLVTDTDMEITLNVADYLESHNIRKIKNEDETYSIILDDIRDIVLK